MHGSSLEVGLKDETVRLLFVKVKEELTTEIKKVMTHVNKASTGLILRTMKTFKYDLTDDDTFFDVFVGKPEKVKKACLGIDAREMLKNLEGTEESLARIKALHEFRELHKKVQKLKKKK